MTAATQVPTVALAAALHGYLQAAETEVARARQARNCEVASLYRDGVPVSQLADILAVSERGLYKILDATEGKA